jgi:ribosomal-protein-alanine N-acetyltransferase
VKTNSCEISFLRERDFEKLTALYENEEVRKYLGGVCAASEAEEKLRTATQSPDEHNFTVRLKDAATVIGLITIAPHHDAKNTEISYMFLPQFWGKGFAKEAINAVLDFCKSNLKLKRVVSETQSANENSCLLLEALGFKIESETERFGAKQRIYFLKL